MLNPWDGLRRYTQARVALGRSGVSLPTASHLAFQLAHAPARDAVHRALDVPALACDLTAIGMRSLALHSAAPDRRTSLRRPDLGRMLEAGSRERLQAEAAALAAGERNEPREPGQPRQTDRADEVHCLELPSSSSWRIAPIAIVEQARVAIGDEVGALFRSALSVVLIGERPGLSAHDSLGLYITWDPQRGRLDAQRNCISNVRPAGLSYDDAAYRLCFLLEEARRRRMTGVRLKTKATWLH